MSDYTPMGQEELLSSLRQQWKMSFGPVDIKSKEIVRLLLPNIAELLDKV